MNSRTVLLPDVGDFDDVTIAQVCLRVGKRVDRGDTMVVIESEKASMDVPSPVAGTVTAVYVKRGDKVSRDDPLFAISPAPLTEDDLRVEMELGRVSVLPPSLTNAEQATGAASRLDRIAAQLRPIISDLQIAYPQIAVVCDNATPSVTIKLCAKDMKVDSTLTWNTLQRRFERVDIINSTVSSEFLEFLGHPKNAHEQRHCFAYVFDEEATLAYARWLGWAVGVLQSERQQ